MKYRPEIDGLRAIAVLPVVLFHAGFNTFSGGYVGVDVFFVISGYLITTVIATELEAGEFKLSRFYERRARRILPALFFVILLAMPFAWIWFSPVDLKDFAQSVVATALFGSNFHFWLESGYFDTATELKPLLHTWSLAVEEQYYVIFPLLLIALTPRSRPFTMGVLAAIALISFSLAEYGSTRYSAATFYLLHARAWELLLGALAALWLIGESRSSGAGVDARSGYFQLLSMVGLVLILGAVFLVDSHTPFPGVYALLPTLGATLIILFARSGTIAYSLLSNRVLVFFGLISYSLYLWHQPVLAFARYRAVGEPSTMLLLGLCFACVLLAYLTWRWVEKPFRDKNKFSQKRIFTLAAAFSGLLIVSGLIVHWNEGFRGRIQIPDVMKWASLAERLEIEGDVCIPKSTTDIPGVQFCYFGELTSTKTVGLYGDSHGQAIAPELDRLLKKRGLRGMRIKSEGCSLVPGVAQSTVLSPGRVERCNKQFKRLTTLLDETVLATVVVSRWTFFLYPIPGTINELQFDNGIGGKEHDARPAEYAALTTTGELTFQANPKKRALQSMLIDLGRATPVILIYPIPEIGWDIFRLNMNQVRSTGAPFDELSYPKSTYDRRHQFVLSVFDELVASSSNVVPVRSDSVFCEQLIEDRCVAQLDGKPLYLDDDHVSDFGARYLIERVNVRIDERLSASTP